MFPYKCIHTHVLYRQNLRTGRKCTLDSDKSHRIETKVFTFLLSNHILYVVHFLYQTKSSPYQEHYSDLILLLPINEPMLPKE